MKERASGSRRLPVSAWAFDSALALVAASLPMAFFASMPVPSGVPVGVVALGYALVLLHALPLVARRRFPGAVLALCVASGLAFAALFMPPFFLGPALLVAVYSVAAYGSRWASLAGLVVAELGLAAVWWTRPCSSGVRFCSSWGSSLLPGCWAASSATARSTPPSWRSGPPSWNGPGRSWPAGRLSRS